MDPVSNADRLVVLLRQKLLERARTAGSAGSKTPAQPNGVRALAAIEGRDERQLRRAFIQNLLADQLGQGLINDARFQQVVSRVTEAIEEDDGASGLLSRLVSELRPL